MFQQPHKIKNAPSDTGNICHDIARGNHLKNILKNLQNKVLELGEKLKHSVLVKSYSQIGIS